MKRDTIGHERIRRYLQTVWEKGRVGQAYLFSGPRHIGKTALALQFIKTLLCEKGTIYGGCLPAQAGGECGTCARIDSHSDPRFVKLEPGAPILASADEDKNEIGIAEIREVRRRLSLKTPGFQAVLVLDAEKLSRDAGNALLKILEEPGEETLFCFVTSNESLVLPTIRSRVISLRASLVFDEALNRISGATKELVRLAAGRPGIFYRMLEDIEFRKRQEKLFRIAESIAAGSPGKAVRLSEEIADDPEARDEVIHYLLIFLETSFRERPNARAAARAAKALKAIGAMETTNVNRRMASDMITMNLAGIHESR